MARLKLDRPPGPALKTLIRRQLSKAASALRQAAATGHVHDARRSLKALRSSLRMVRPAIGEAHFKAADRLLSRAAKRLASARHGEAMAETAAKIGDGAIADAVTAFAARASVERPVSAGVASAAAEALAEILQLSKDVKRWPLPHGDLKPYVAGLQACFGRARRLLRKGLRLGDTERLHEARKSVIHHLHHVEMLGSVWPGLFAAWLRDLNQLRLALGDLNDLDDLEHAVGPELEPDAWAVIAMRRRRLIATIAGLSGVLLAEKPNAYAARMEAMWRHAMAGHETQG